MTVDSDMEKARSTNNFTQYSYPLTPGQHNMVLVFKDYNYRSATSSGFVRGEDRAVSSKIDASVSLPIPNNLTDTYNVKVGPYELGVSGALALDTLGGSGRADLMADAQRAFSAGSEGGVNTGDAVSTAGSTFKVASAFMGRNVLDKLPGAGGINTAIDMRTGNTVNPHVALKFDGVDLKQHTFNWQLSPRSEAEARQLKDLLQFVKARMLPAYALDGDSSVSRALLTYPNLVDIFFTGIDQNYFYYFKPVMINTFTTDFTPQGLALNKGGRPSFINCTMTVTEAQIHTRGDIEGMSQAAGDGGE